MRNTTMLEFSFVIPCYNNIELLKKTLAGLCLNQGKAWFEVILVDNNSFEEDINEAYRKYVDKLELYLLRQPRLAHPKATCRARNLGLALARGEWIVNLDADCVPMPDYLSHLRTHLETIGRDNSIIAGLRRFVDLSHHTEDDILEGSVDYAALPRVRSPSNYDRVEDRRLPYLEHLGDSEHPWAYFHSCNIAYRKSTAVAVDGFDEAFDGAWGYEDVDFAHRMITLGRAIPRYLPGIDCLHQDSELSNSQNRFDKAGNPNWRIITKRIPGYEQYKTKQYQELNKEIHL